METSTPAAIDDLAAQGWEQRDTDRPGARALGERAHARGLEAGYAAGAARGLTLLSFLDYRESRYDQAIARALEAAATLEAAGDWRWLTRAFNILAITYDTLGDRGLAHTYLHRQIALSQELGDVEGEATGYHDLALSYGELEPALALSYMERALQLAAASGQRATEANGRYNLATLYARLGQAARAYAYCAEALGQARELGVGDLVVYAQAELGRICVELRRVEEGEGHLGAALALARADYPELVFLALSQLGRAALHRGDYAAALGFLREGLDLVEPTGFKQSIAQLHQLLLACHEGLGDYKAALEHSKAYVALRDAIYGEESEAKVRAMEVAHRTQMALRDAAVERERTAQLQRSIQELEALRDTLHEMSLRDYLTGLYNRRYLIDSGERLLAQAQRYGGALCVAMLDVDHFKRINDTLSHRTGDRVLQQVAALARQSTRDADIVARYGGEEFVLLLPETDLAAGLTACERLRETVEQEPWARIDPGLSVTISVGVAAAAPGLSFEELLALADERLYAAKGAGRNRVIGQGAAVL